MISCLPEYNYAFFFFLAFSCLFQSLLFLENTKKVYNIQNNRLCFHDMKNLSLRLGCIRVNNSSLRTRCLRVFSQAFVTDFSYHGNTMYYSLFNVSCVKESNTDERIALFIKQIQVEYMYIHKHEHANDSTGYLTLHQHS